MTSNCRRLSTLKEPRYSAHYHALIGLCKKAKFFDMTRTILDACREKHFVFLYFDADDKKILTCQQKFSAIMCNLERSG